MLLGELSFMTDAQAKALAEKYAQLEKLRDAERSKPFGSQVEINACEDRMADIEAKFQRADMDIRQWLE